jgi:hypothetical protein
MADDGANGSNDSNEMAFLVAGVGFLIVGAGLLLANPSIRQQAREALGRVLPAGLLEPGNLAGGLATIVPDFERYMKLRSM